MARQTGFFEHQGKRIYLLDLEALPAEQVIGLVESVAREVRAQPPGSILSLTHVKGAVVTAAVVERLRWLAAGNRPYVKAAAVAGLSPAQKIVFNVLRTFTGREFRLFKTFEEARDWLAGVP